MYFSPLLTLASSFDAAHASSLPAMYPTCSERGVGRGVSDQYVGWDETCPISTGGLQVLEKEQAEEGLLSAQGPGRDWRDQHRGGLGDASGRVMGGPHVQ